MMTPGFKELRDSILP